MRKSIDKFAVISLALISVFLFTTYAFCQQSPLIKSGIEQYKNEKYEEAIETFKKARNEDSKSTVAAFFLGMAYKQTMDYEKAFSNLRDAVTQTPRIKDALTEIVDVAMQLGEIEEAKKWIEVAERENISPAKIAFLKGLVLTEEGKNKEAAASFEKAKSIDPEISQAADIQIALSYMRERELKKAKSSFEAAIIGDPQSDLAGFARQYLDAVDQRLAAEKPLRYTLSHFGQYDDNMILKPDDQSAATGITNEGSGVFNSSFRVNYAPVSKGKWLFNAQYAITASLHDKNKATHDSLSNSVSITPGYNFGDYALNLAINYNHSLIRRPSYKRYSGTLRAGPLVRVALKGNQLLEVFAGFTNNQLFQPALAPEEDRDSTGYGTYLSWIWLFKENAFLNLRFQSFYQDTEGRNWDNMLNGISANLAVPIHDKVKFQLSGQYNKQDYLHYHTTFGVIREDELFNFSGGFTWNCIKGTTLVVQYSRVEAVSNIDYYDYTRNLYSLGLEYRF